MPSSPKCAKIRFCVVTTIPESLYFFKGQLNYLKRKFEVVAVSSNGEVLNKFGDSEVVETHCIPMKRPIALFSDFISLLRFIAYFVRTRPDIVHGNTPKASFLSMVASKLTKVHRRIYMCHGLRYQGYSGVMRKLLMAMERISCVCATDVICVSYGVMNTLNQDGICKADKLKVIGNGSVNGIDATRFSRGAIPEEQVLKIIDNKCFTFCFVGRIVKDKGINELVLAFKRLAAHNVSVRLMLIGMFEDNENSVDEQTKMEIKNNSRIIHYGRQTDVRPYMCASDVLVLPSYREGFGMVLMEAGALGVPCITTDIIGCNEVVHDGENGLLIPPRDEEALLNALTWMYEHRHDDVKRMSACARTFILERFEQQKLWKAYIEEYSRML